jgi:hypothetical protein
MHSLISYILFCPSPCAVSVVDIENIILWLIRRIQRCKDIYRRICCILHQSLLSSVGLERLTVIVNCHQKVLCSTQREEIFFLHYTPPSLSSLLVHNHPPCFLPCIVIEFCPSQDAGMLIRHHIITAETTRERQQNGEMRGESFNSLSRDESCDAIVQCHRLPFVLSLSELTCCLFYFSFLVCGSQ